MAIEKMIMLSMIGPVGDLKNAARAIVIAGCIEPVNALNEIDIAAFEIQDEDKKFDAEADIFHIKPYSSSEDYSDSVKKMDKIRELISHYRGGRLNDNELIKDYSSLNTQIANMSRLIENITDEIQEKKSVIDHLEQELKHMRIMKELPLPVQEIRDLKHFKFELLRIHIENMRKIEDNYENIPSIILPLSRDKDYDFAAVFTPFILKDEADKIFKSLNCEEIILDYSEEGTSEEISYKIQKHLEALKEEIGELEQELNKIADDKKSEIYILDKSLEVELKTSEVKKCMACSKEFFYFSGWVPKGAIRELGKFFKPFEDRVIISKKEAKEVNQSIIPPTRMKNNRIVRPFESLVTMYGIPSYDELDPTTFLGVSYMFLFGAMFGDIGQGFIFLLAGLILKIKKRHTNFGGILFRVGISSVFFGFLYGSIFGNEELIDALLIRPMDDIMTILVYGVAFGCVLLSMSYIFSLINNFRIGNLETGLFGKEGLTGFIFFISLLTFAYTKYMRIYLIPDLCWYMLFLAAVVLMLFKQPLSNLILGVKPLYREDRLGYYVEGSFGIVETLISLFSNTLSFVRVGAFAINHVGLFMAFRVLGEMMQGIGGILTYILGNVIIIGLEGLIVFIQGLRLEYYELFSKYFQGGGKLFEPVRVSEIKVNS